MFKPAAKYYNRPGKLSLKTRVSLRKYASDTDFRANKPYEISEHWGNTGLNTGIAKLWDLVTGATDAGYWGTGTLSYVGTGTASTAATATQTGLLGATQAYASQDATYPSRASQTVTWEGTFTSLIQNAPWLEFTVSNTATGSGEQICRVVSDQGVKVSGQTWQLQIAITMS